MMSISTIQLQNATEIDMDITLYHNNLPNIGNDDIDTDPN